MASSIPSFQDFEHAGWNNEHTCEKYDQYFGAVTIQSVSALLDAAGVTKNSLVLDVRTGAGYAAGLAAERGALATGIDFSAAQVELAREHYNKPTFHKADGTDLPFPDESFNCVINSIGIPHFFDPDAAISEAFRVLKRGGSFAFSVYDIPERSVGFGAVYRAVQAYGSMDIDLPQGPNFFLFSDPVVSQKRLTAAGFESVQITSQQQTWSLTSPEDAIEAVLHGSVRAAATLSRQVPEVLSCIRQAISDSISMYKQGKTYEVPMPVIIASATKP